MKLQDGLELSEGWKHISVNSITPVTGNDVNISRRIYIKWLGAKCEIEEENQLLRWQTGAEVVSSLMVWDPILWNRRIMSPQQRPVKDRPRVGGTALVRVALGSTRNTERNGISPRYGNLCLCLAAWIQKVGQHKLESKPYNFL